MSAVFLPESRLQFQDHPQFSGVRIAKLVSAQNSDAVSVSRLDISPGIEVPVHTHEDQLDSIYVISGQGQAYLNNQWRDILAGDYLLAPAQTSHGVRNTGDQPLQLFVHHSPPLF